MVWRGSQRSLALGALSRIVVGRIANMRRQLGGLSLFLLALSACGQGPAPAGMHHFCGELEYQSISLDFDSGEYAFGDLLGVLRPCDASGRRCVSGIVVVDLQAMESPEATNWCVGDACFQRIEGTSLPPVLIGLEYENAVLGHWETQDTVALYDATGEVTAIWLAPVVSQVCH